MATRIHNGIMLRTYDALPLHSRLPEWKIPALARADAFADIEKHGLAYAYGNVECSHAQLQIKGHFDLAMLLKYAVEYEQAVLGHFMAME